MNKPAFTEGESVKEVTIADITHLQLLLALPVSKLAVNGKLTTCYRPVHRPVHFNKELLVIMFMHRVFIRR